MDVNILVEESNSWKKVYWTKKIRNWKKNNYWYSFFGIVTHHISVYCHNELSVNDFGSNFQRNVLYLKSTFWVKKAKRYIVNIYIFIIFSNTVLVTYHLPKFFLDVNVLGDKPNNWRKKIESKNSKVKKNHFSAFMDYWIVTNHILFFYHVWNFLNHFE